MGRPNKLLLYLIDELRRQVELCYKPGEPIPSQRELAQTYGATHSTIHRALLALSQEKLVAPIRRVGWVRTPAARFKAAKIDRRKPLRPLRVGLISRRTPGAWASSELLRAILDEAKRRRVQVIEAPNRRRSTSTPGRARVELTRVPWNTFDVGLLAEIEDPLTLSDPLLKNHRVLSVDQDSTFLGLDSTAFANWDAGVLAARHLFDLGHRRFAVTDEVNDEGWMCDASWTARRQGFEFMLSWLGGVIRPEWRLPVKRAGWRKELSIQKTIAAWAARPVEQRPTALLSLETGALREVLAACADHQIAIPDDLSVITICWSAAEAQYHGLQLTHFLFDLGELVRRTFEAAAQIAADTSYFNAPRRKAFCETIPGKLMTGASTRVANPGAWA